MVIVISVVIIILVLLGMGMLLTMYAAGYEDGVSNRYRNSARGIMAHMYDVGFNNAAGIDQRRTDNKRRNNERRTKREAKVNA